MWMILGLGKNLWLLEHDIYRFVKVLRKMHLFGFFSNHCEGPLESQMCGMASRDVDEIE